MSPPGQWAPVYPAPQAPRSRLWPAIALGAIVLALVSTVVAVVALVVATTLSSSSSSALTTAAPTYSAADVTAAHQKLCDAYKLAARSVDIDTNTDNRALAGAVSVNAAVLLEQAVNAAPALAPGDRAAALTLAAAYTKATAMGSALQRDDPAFSAEVDDVNAKDSVMKRVCGVG
ncbi:hypothetical protein DQP57_10365 [Mycobacterium colombiense]|uniref:Alanine and proline rich membrane protein n=1 Tax=Mycobacterium colombiense TaxID=339268 RepID=A0A329M538_9MYCO|nr:hypothetical protein DQP57_10365 [Mycobacterium colombiense]